MTEIKVIKSDVCEKSTTTDNGETKTIITVPTGQEVRAGQSTVYPVAISNLGSTAKTYVISVSPSVDSFGTYRIDPNNVIVIPGQTTETAYVYLTVDENADSGLKDFKITVTSDGESKDATLTASIISEKGTTGSVSDSLKTGLQISLLVLFVLLLILLVIFGFNKMKGSKEDEEDEDDVGQTYY